VQFCLSQVVLPTLSLLGIFCSAVRGCLGEEGRGKDVSSLKRIARIWDEEGLGRVWIDPAVIGMVQVNSREGLACILLPKARLWVDERLQDTF